MAILEIYMPTHNLRCGVCNWSGVDQVPASCPQCHAPFDAAVIQAVNGSWLFAHKPGSGAVPRRQKGTPANWSNRGVEVSDAN